MRWAQEWWWHSAGNAEMDEQQQVNGEEAKNCHILSWYGESDE
jgi:hypothetical protein